MKRYLSLLLCFVLVISLCCSCGKNAKDISTESGVSVDTNAGGVFVPEKEPVPVTDDTSAEGSRGSDGGLVSTVTNALDSIFGKTDGAAEESVEGSVAPDYFTDSKATLDVAFATTESDYTFAGEGSGFAPEGSGFTGEGSDFTGEKADGDSTVTVDVDAILPSEEMGEAEAADYVITDLTDLPWLEEPVVEPVIGEITDPVIDPISDDPADPVEPIDPEWPIDPDWPIEPIITPEPYIPEINPGLLTAAEWNDNKNFSFLQNLIKNGQQDNYIDYFRAWSLTPFNRIPVQVTEADGVTPLAKAKVVLLGTLGETLWTSVTDHEGMAYLFYNLTASGQVPAQIFVEKGAAVRELSATELSGESTVVINTGYTSEASVKALDLMFVIDTTGSMGDEIYYLQAELQDIINRVTGNASDIRLSINFYRDHGDDYIVKSSAFTTDIKSQAALLNTQYASGGGDYEEAVEEALEDAINAHDWREDSIKLCFMVLDAPPHNTNSIKAQLASTLTDASAKGVRIIPVASSGVDRSTEFLLRTMSMVTGGTYTFLTDDSGIGGSHLEPIVGDYDVVNLNDLLVKIINEYLN